MADGSGFADVDDPTVTVGCESCGRMKTYSREKLTRFRVVTDADRLYAIARELGCHRSYCELDFLGPRAPRAK
jgi:hypothetical protein